MIFETERLLVRPWRANDHAPMAAILGDPISRRFHPGTLTPAQTSALLARFNAEIMEIGFSAAAIEHKEDGRFLGLIGITKIPEVVKTAIAGRPEWEIAWQIDRTVWGQGFAPEGAAAWLDYAWHTLRLQEVVAFTFEKNFPSRRVMEKIGMQHNVTANFAHPKLTPTHALSQHVLYQARNPLL